MNTKDIKQVIRYLWRSRYNKTDTSVRREPLLPNWPAANLVYLLKVGELFIQSEGLSALQLSAKMESILLLVPGKKLRGLDLTTADDATAVIMFIIGCLTSFFLFGSLWWNHDRLVDSHEPWWWLRWLTIRTLIKRVGCSYPADFFLLSLRSLKIWLCFVKKNKVKIYIWIIQIDLFSFTETELA